MSRLTSKSKSRRVAFDRSMPRAGSDATITLSVSSAKLRCTSNVPISISDIPRILATGGAHSGNTYPTAVTVVSPLVFDCTYAAAVAVADVITIPERDPAIRTPSGGYMVPQTKTL